MSRLRRLRYRIGAYLLRPHFRAVHAHYAAARERQICAGKFQEAERCQYIGIGIQFAGKPLWYEDAYGPTEKTSDGV